MYVSPTHGLLTLDQVFEKVKEFAKSEPKAEYHAMIGCDSQVHKDSLALVSAIIIQRVGNGAIFFTEREILRQSRLETRERMYKEASRSIERAIAFKQNVLDDESILPMKLTVHLDVGRNGKTSAYVRELVGYVESCGFTACIKDISRLYDSLYEYPIAASCVADKYSK